MVYLVRSEETNEWTYQGKVVTLWTKDGRRLVNEQINVIFKYLRSLNNTV